MKVNRMDASGVSYTSLKEKDTEDNNITNTMDEESSSKVNAESRNISNLTSSEKKELPIAEKVLIDAIEKANKAISGGTRRFEFSIHEKTKEIMVKVINSDTNEVIREIPPEKTLDMVAKMWEMAGIIVDERR